MDPMNSFPKDVAILTFSHLDIHALGNCMRVSRKWHELASEDIVWKRLLETLYPRLFLALPKDINVRQYFKTHSVTTLDEVIERIDIFLQGTPKDQNRSFTCYFPPNLQDCVLEVAFRYYSGIIKKENTIHSREFLVFIGKLPPDNTSRGVMEEELIGGVTLLDIKCKLTTFENTKKCIRDIEYRSYKIDESGTKDYMDSLLLL